MLVIIKMSVLTHAIIVSLILNICVSDNDKDARTVFWDNVRNPDGSYHFRYQTSNGIQRDETGTLLGEKENAILKVIGYYKYPNGDGTFVSKRYEADEEGYRVEGYYSDPDPSLFPTQTFTSLMQGGLGRDETGRVVGGKNKAIVKVTGYYRDHSKVPDGNGYRHQVINAPIPVPAPVPHPAPIPTPVYMTYGVAVPEPQPIPIPAPIPVPAPIPTFVYLTMTGGGLGG